MSARNYVLEESRRILYCESLWLGDPTRAEGIAGRQDIVRAAWIERMLGLTR
jgi:hypothetical protein